MGHIRHHAIVVTSFDGDTIEAAHAEATRLGCAVTPVVKSGINGYLSFLIATDGSKTGWSNSDEGDAQRDEWVDWARERRYDDGSSPLEWAEVEYGSDDSSARVSRHEWQRSRSRPPLPTGGEE